MATDMFLKLEGIKGESLDHKHKDEIEVLSWSFGMSQQGTFAQGGGGGAGKVNIQDLNFTKSLDFSSTALMLNCASGKHIPTALLTVRKAGENPLEYLKIKLTDILVSSVQDSCGGSEQVMESVSLNFAKIQVEYFKQSAKGGADGGPATMGWDVKKNVKV